ncbi:MAG: hypothetical protein ACRBBU_05870 [Pseudooceanicola sp.]
MLSILSEYFTVATRIHQDRMRDFPTAKHNAKGRWRANRNWRDLPEEF